MDVLHDLDQLTIFLTTIEACDWHAIAQLPSEGENLIIDDQSASQVDSVEDVQVLVVRLLALVRNGLAVLAEESVLNKST